MVEHQLPKLAFAGSIPVSRSTRHLFTGAFCKVSRESNREPRGTSALQGKVKRLKRLFSGMARTSGDSRLPLHEAPVHRCFLKSLTIAERYALQGGVNRV